MSGSLKDKVALVTSAGSGIGQDIAHQLSAEGARGDEAYLTVDGYLAQ